MVSVHGRMPSIQAHSIQAHEELMTVWSTRIAQAIALLAHDGTENQPERPVNWSDFEIIADYF
jgi:hypothetical protein